MLPLCTGGPHETGMPRVVKEGFAGHDGRGGPFSTGGKLDATLADCQARVDTGFGGPQGEVRGRLESGGSGLLIEGKVWGRSVGCLVDTGATVNILSLAWWRAHGEQGEMLAAAGSVYFS